MFLNQWTNLDSFTLKHIDLKLFTITCKGDRQLLSAGPLGSDQNQDKSPISTLPYCCLSVEPTSMSNKIEILAQIISYQLIVIVIRSDQMCEPSIRLLICHAPFQNVVWTKMCSTTLRRLFK